MYQPDNCSRLSGCSSGGTEGGAVSASSSWAIFREASGKTSRILGSWDAPRTVEISRQSESGAATLAVPTLW